MIKYIRHEELYFWFKYEGEKILAFCGVTGEEKEPREEVIPFSVGISGENLGQFFINLSAYSPIAMEMRLESVYFDEKGIRLLYKNNRLNFSVLTEIEFIKGASLFAVTNTLENNGDEEISLIYLSSGILHGVSRGIKNWYEEIYVNFCRSTWQGEGQWQRQSLKDAGVYPTTEHPDTNALNVTSKGSFTTCKFFPMLFLERPDGSVWYTAVEPCGSWNIQVASRKGWFVETGEVYLEACCMDESRLGNSIILKKGQSYRSCRAVFGIAPGKNKMLKDLTLYRRAFAMANEREKQLLVTFNDYMNCLWAAPSKEKLLPLIDRAAEVGCECFIIDSGWYIDHGQQWGDILGDWRLSSNRFGEMGLSGIISYIKAKGMRPGVWLEMEVAGKNSWIFRNKPDSWFLMSHGMRLGGGPRYFLNFENTEVREYLFGVFDSLAAIGVEAIKNDYNECYYTGDDSISPGEGVRKNLEAFYSFIDEVRIRHPQLIIENCGSGGMRADFGAMRHFHYQSITDQVDYIKMPSIIGGVQYNLLPEHMGIWAYPMPCLFGNRELEGEQLVSAVMAASSPDSTVFNMVSGMCGQLYLSGRIDLAEGENLSFIAEGIKVYKEIREFIRDSYPVVLMPHKHLLDERGFYAVGYADENMGQVLIAVWRYMADTDRLHLNLSDNLERKIRDTKILYPKNAKCGEISFTQYDFTVKLYRDFSAMLVKVELE